MTGIIRGLLLGHVLYGASAATPELLAAIGLGREPVERLRRDVAPGVR